MKKFEKFYIPNKKEIDEAVVDFRRKMKEMNDCEFGIAELRFYPRTGKFEIKEVSDKTGGFDYVVIPSTTGLNQYAAPTNVQVREDIFELVCRLQANKED